MAIPQLTTDGGRRPLTRGLWNPATWMTYIRCGLDLETLGVIKEDMQRLVITIQTREAELDAVEEKLRKAEDALAQARRVNDSIHADLRAAQLRETRLIRERDEAQTARAHTASDNLELVRKLECADNRVCEWQASYFALRDELARYKRSAADRAYMRTQYESYDAPRVGPEPTWTLVERNTTEHTTNSGAKERTVVTREVAS